MSLPLHLVALLARERFWLVPVFVILLVLVPGGRGARTVAGRLLVAALGAGNLLGGPLLSGWLLAREGQAGTAQVVGTYRTWTEVNGHQVVGYHVLIRDEGGTVYESRFADDELNVFPPADFSEPRVGERFYVRFLPGFPRDFVMITDADSPWNRRNRCDVLSLRLSEAERRFGFGGGAVPFRAPYVAAIDAYLAQGCAGEEPGPQTFRDDRAHAVAGEVQAQP